MSRIASLIATCFAAGRARKAPGTAGSLAALPMVALLHYAGLPWLLPPLTLAALLLGVWASGRYLAETGQSGDPKEIVIDEVAGQWLVFAAMPLYYLPAMQSLFWPVLMGGFLAFRFFDILKPWPISLIDRRMKGPWGIMLDDIAAGLFALITLGLLGHLPLIMHYFTPCSGDACV